MLKAKTTFNGRGPQILKFSSNLKLKLRGRNQNQKSSKGRLPQMENDLKIFKLGDLSNFKLKLRVPNQNQNTQNKDDLQRKTTSNGRRPPNIKT